MLVGLLGNISILIFHRLTQWTLTSSLAIETAVMYSELYKHKPEKLSGQSQDFKMKQRESVIPVLPFLHIFGSPKH